MIIITWWGIQKIIWIYKEWRKRQILDIAIEISKHAKYPYGAIVVKDGEIIGRSDDKTLMETSMYSHAELEAIEKIYRWWN